MGQENISERRWVLSDAAFSVFLNWLAPNEHQAGEKYESLRRKLCIFFEHRGCPAPEEMADKTLDRAARKLEANEEILLLDPTSFCYGIAQNILKEFWRGPSRNTISLDSQPSGSNSLPIVVVSQAATEDQKEIEINLDHLNACLQNLSPSDRELILRYYEGDHRDRINNRHELALRLGIPPGTLRIRALRIREQLLNCMKNCDRNGFSR